MKILYTNLFKYHLIMATKRRITRSSNSEKENLGIKSPYFQRNKMMKLEESAESKLAVKKKTLSPKLEQNNAIINLKSEPTIPDEEKSVYFSKIIAQKNEPFYSENSKWEPKLWREQLSSIINMRSSLNAPVDTMGCDCLANALPKSPQNRRFCILISVMLSSQTRDEVTAKAIGELEKLPLDIHTILNTSEEAISKAIYPVSFYKVLII